MFAVHVSLVFLLAVVPCARSTNCFAQQGGPARQAGRGEDPTAVALDGVWRQRDSAEGMRLQKAKPIPYSTVLMDAERMLKHDVDMEAATRWKEQACFAEDTLHSCYYHGDSRAATLAQREFVPSGCSLKEYEAEETLLKLQGQRVIFLGDSHSRQHWQAFVCPLREHLVAVDTAWERHNWNSQTNCPFEGNKHCYAKQSCAVFQHNVTICIDSDMFDGIAPHRVTEANLAHVADLKKGKPPNAVVQRLRSKMGEADVFVMNFGGHYNTANEASQYEAHLQPLADAIAHERTRRPSARFVWRECPEYQFGSTRSTCAPSSLPQQKWRNKVANKLMVAAGAEILPVYYVSHSQWDAHVQHTLRKDTSLLGFQSTFDCAHWCLPGVPDTWAMLLSNLLFN